MPKIMFNGQEYENVAAMPPEVRRLYESMTNVFADKDGNGVPDILEGGMGNVQSSTVSQFIVDGKAYSRLEDLPPEQRARYTAAMAKLDANQNSIPDILEGDLFSALTGSANPTSATQTPSTSAAPPAGTAIPTVKIVGDRPSPGMMRMMVIGLVILVVVAIIAYLIGNTLGR